MNSDAEILGNAYEYLIGQFASETGKKAGEFYTLRQYPKSYRIAIAGQEENRDYLSMIHAWVPAPFCLMQKICEIFSVYQILWTGIKYFDLQSCKNEYVSSWHSGRESELEKRRHS